MSTDSVSVVRIGVSTCLLGEKVRFDGGHKRDPFLNDAFAHFVDWVPVCPEVEAGFGTPREAMRLVRVDDAVRLITVRTKVDVTAPLLRAVESRTAKLVSMDLDGYVLKKDSPSCGLYRVKVYGDSGHADRGGRGLFAQALAEALPLLPLEEEGRLGDPRLRENFIERVFAYRRLREFFASKPRVGDLMRFHTRHKLLLLAHSPAKYAALGRMVAGVRGRLSQHVMDEYAESFMGALAVLASRGRHANVLQHMAGYFEDFVDADSRRELTETIADYQHGLVPLVVPITLIVHHARRHDVRYLLDQVYLRPHPKELMLRNHV